jgi:hypothetical protein
LGHNRDGTPCKARPRPGRTFCLWHDGSLSAERATWRQRGGANRSDRERARKALAGNGVDLASVTATLIGALTKVETGVLPPGAATAMAHLAKAILALVQADDFERRLAELERMAAGGRGG